ncbi:hypothetical protein BEP19_01345 [Ammoniphilus oxalaticus]|uniref:SLH domain-containing protein n=1 Tax=Ammoniphilus oxalaticus TaxID=66863 RepID=A0A419SMT6_9BACL|nr:S-layer homology domain-containing protein [Ammoniphilus oxalaticus]RKD25616.1 hypothetical protein BEP19_01345 [Ammoniphilus oxalaticus]
MVFLKRTILAAAILSMSMTAVQAETAAPFKDIADSFAYSSIASLHQKGLISGVSKDEFAPQASIKRKHFVLLLAKTIGVQPITPLEPSFVDVPIESVEFGYIEAFARLGYIQGFDDNTFKGDAFIKRQDVAVILDHIFKQATTLQSLSTESITFKDQEQIHPYARESVQRVAAMSLMRGYQQTFSPQKNVSRAETAVIAQQVYERIRQTQEIRRLPEVNLTVGDRQQIVLPFTNTTFTYTPVWGWDNPAIGTIKADGEFSATAAGKGVISLNIGNKTYQIPVKIEPAKEIVEEVDQETDRELDQEVENNVEEEETTA